MAKKRSHSDSPKLFHEQIVPAEPGSGKLFDVEYTSRNESVTCLGMTFKDDQARRAYFTEELRKKLKDPEFRKIEGFPIGEDEDILSLSDPPFYTACPNPWLAAFIAEWENRKPAKPSGWTYNREPFAANVSEGKNDPIYNAHSYHTKVPPRAIARYILNYTEPGDLIFDGFCGTGMTAVAAQICGDRNVVESMGFHINNEGLIFDASRPEGDHKAISRIGARRAIINDISPAATYISHCYNRRIPIASQQQQLASILTQAESDFKWMFQTLHLPSTEQISEATEFLRSTNTPDLSSICATGEINYIVWSDVFICPECSSDFVFWNVAVDVKNGRVKDTFQCPSCSRDLGRRDVDYKRITIHDSEANGTTYQKLQVPAYIVYSVGGKRYQKKADTVDNAIADKINALKVVDWYPDERIKLGDKTGEPLRVGFERIHHFYTQRILHVLARFRSFGLDTWGPFSALTPRATRMHRIAASRIGGEKKGVGGATVGIINGTLYVPSLSVEMNIFDQARERFRAFAAASFAKDESVISTQSSSNIHAIPDNSIDYAFIDPPFGANLMYSELNLIWEGWLRVKTDNRCEAIENNNQKKGASEYRELMKQCFKEVYRILKSGRWVTIEFSNTNAAIWNAIQGALQDAGLVVANVSALDKQQGSFNAVTNPTSVKQDLVISAYKPNGGFEERFPSEATSEEGVWDFVRTHLKYLPVIKRAGPVLQFITERDPRILFDQMVAYYVRKGYAVPVSSQEFQSGLSSVAFERDGMYFLPDQVAEYDRAKAIAGQLQQSFLFVSDESSAINWLRQQLKEKPQSFSDLNPQFMQQLGGWSKNEQQLDLRDLLNQNFLNYDGKGPVPEQIHAYLSTNWKDMRNLVKDDPQLVSKAKDRWYVPDPNKAGDLEKLRERALLKEFEEYKQLKRKFKASDRFRLEAVRAGFKKAWQDRDYPTIVAVAAKLPSQVLEEDAKLMMWYDQAVTRSGDGA